MAFGEIASDAFFSSDGEDGFSLLLSRRKQNKSNYAAEAAHKFG
jgi:hypothetical protein